MPGDDAGEWMVVLPLTERRMSDRRAEGLAAALKDDWICVGIWSKAPAASTVSSCFQSAAAAAVHGDDSRAINSLWNRRGAPSWRRSRHRVEVDFL
jgi:hypothetical protein